MRAKRKYYFIYIIKNSLNGKSYVGFHSTNNLNDGYMGGGIAINRAYKKHGSKNFEKNILEFCNEDNWQEREKYWIKKMNTYGNGYNLTKGGEGLIGVVFSDETKNKMSNIRKERGLAKGKNNGMFNNHHTTQACQNMSKTKKELGVAKGSKNSTFDHTIYHFINKETKEVFIGHKFDLSQKIGSRSSALNSVIKGRRNHHKNWVLS